VVHPNVHIYCITLNWVVAILSLSYFSILEAFTSNLSFVTTTELPSSSSCSRNFLISLSLVFYLFLHGVHLFHHLSHHSGYLVHTVYLSHHPCLDVGAARVVLHTHECQGCAYLFPIGVHHLGHLLAKVETRLHLV
jgi:hypothetical protein